MILRAVTLTVGLAGGFGAAQFPAYSQQYLQRLGGAVDALHQVVSDFDTSARAEGLSRQDALAQMTGSAFVERRRDDMTRTIQRYETLSADLGELQGKGPFSRAYLAARLTDPEIASQVWRTFQPALPLTMPTWAFAAFGFWAAALVLRLLWAAVRLAFRRRPLPA